MPDKGPDRAVLFIDGNNWYHALTEAHVWTPGDMKYKKLSQKLIGPREWVETRYYIGALKQHHNKEDYANQRRFLSRISAEDARITRHLGRIETRDHKNDLAVELGAWAESAKGRISDEDYYALKAMANHNEVVKVDTEKAVDVMIAVDMVLMARDGEYDAAYLLSADGDFTPAVKAAKEFGCKVYGVTVEPQDCAALRRVCDSYVVKDKDFFRDCY